ncbi:MAG: hypothetical protein EZS28_019374, partial [Streblomastix strix]
MKDYFHRGVHFEEAYIKMSETYGGICPEKETLNRWGK